MNNFRSWRQDFAVRGVSWRRGLDWAIKNIPFCFHPFLIFFWTLFFFFFAGASRRAVLSNVAVIFPGSNAPINYLRAFRVFHNFAWTLTDSAVHRIHQTRFDCELNGANIFDELLAARGAIVLTAHMGSYDLGAALFAEQFQREMRMVRAPESDEASAQHVDLALKQAGAGSVKVDYSGAGDALSLDLLNALRRGEIISIQGDRAVENVSSAQAQLFGHEVSLPSGPFVLALIAPAPIYPLFVVRTGYRKYRIIVREPIVCPRTARSRDEDLAEAMAEWSRVLERMINEHWAQWYAFTPIFASDKR
jgi:phosphatidylinositol dimannoside acyltransferase